MYERLSSEERRGLRLLINEAQRAKISETFGGDDFLNDGYVDLRDGMKHGTESAYNNCKCRCQACRGVANMARRERNRKERELKSPAGVKASDVPFIFAGQRQIILAPKEAIIYGMLLNESEKTHTIEALCAAIGQPPQYLRTLIWTLRRKLAREGLTGIETVYRVGYRLDRGTTALYARAGA